MIAQGEVWWADLGDRGGNGCGVLDGVTCPGQGGAGRNPQSRVLDRQRRPRRRRLGRFAACCVTINPNDHAAIVNRYALRARLDPRPEHRRFLHSPFGGCHCTSGLASPYPATALSQGQSAGRALHARI